ncbi:MAG: hypothetical protein JWL64_1592 [Frankiales bacterium]|nr:hypothetical protein [Frankiales bacterium]
MIRKLTFVAAFGAGYVLGAKAGKQRYEQIKGTVQTVAAKPAVHSATEKVQAKAGDLADTAKGKAGDVAVAAKDKAAEKIHLASKTEPVEPTPVGSEPPGIILDGAEPVELSETPGTGPIR